MTIAKNKAQVAADAAARNKEFQADKRAKAVEKASKRVKENTGTGRDGSFGAGTVGQGMPSNPDFRGPGNNKGFGKSESSDTNTPAKAVRVATAVKSTPSKSTGRGGRGQGGGKASRAKGGSFGGKKGKSSSRRC